MIYSYDGTQEQCPLPLVKMRLLLKKMCCDDECIILLSDAGSISDIPAFLAKKGYLYSEQTLANGNIEIKIKYNK